jgi:hypothetical protein
MLLVMALLKAAISKPKVLTVQFSHTMEFHNNPGTDNSHNISIDYVYPVSDNITFEMGAKTIFQHITN